MRATILLTITASLLMGLAAAPAHALTDEQVVKAIEAAQKWLISQQNKNGSWPEVMRGQAKQACGHTEIATFTLVYTGIHPNHPAISKALNVLLNRKLGFTYAVAMRCMAYAYIQRKLSGEKRDRVRGAMNSDVAWLCRAQGSHGGWNYTSLGGGAGRYDFSNTQMAILALREAALAGAEIPKMTWGRAQNLYWEGQRRNGGWGYMAKGNDTRGSMTAAGLASIFITMDNLNLASGCPCRNGRSASTGGEFDRRVDAALGWLEKNFTPAKNPGHPKNRHQYYWLYSVERVGMAAGYKYFGNRDWFHEGASLLVRQQKGGHWTGHAGAIPETCFATLFLYKGRAPILFNKLEFDNGVWNAHRRDIANVVQYAEKMKEQLFQWQIVSLRAPVEELHDAPVLYITAETIPNFTGAQKKKLREFTDTGGTILLEASCGNAQVRTWARAFVKEVWPEWDLKPLGPDHGSFTDPYPLDRRPEILGLHDGMRTFLFYSMDDISCPWQMKAFIRGDYLFKWGINLHAYATDHGPLRARLQERRPVEKDRYTAAVSAGALRNIRIVRVKYGDPGWMANRNYGAWNTIKQYAQKKAGIFISVKEAGTAPGELASGDVAYLIGLGEVSLTADEKQALKAYLNKGGFLWAEAAGGNAAFARAMLALAGDLGLTIKRVPQTDPIITGRFPSGAKGYSLISGVQFKRALRVQRLGRAHAELMGFYNGGKLVGVFSPIDIIFSATGYDAYENRGYDTQDAKAVATNLLIYLSTR